MKDKLTVETYGTITDATVIRMSDDRLMREVWSFGRDYTGGQGEGTIILYRYAKEVRKSTRHRLWNVLREPINGAADHFPHLYRQVQWPHQGYGSDQYAPTWADVPMPEAVIEAAISAIRARYNYKPHPEGTGTKRR